VDNAPNPLNEDWVRTEWGPYVRSAARFCRHGAFRGIYLDDTFPAVPSRVDAYLSYSAADARRFRQWLEDRYLTIENLSMRHKLERVGGGYRSFRTITPPVTPTENLALWTDWMAARADWCEAFARATTSAYRSVDSDPAHHVVLSSQDYHVRCSWIQYGADYSRLMKHFDRLETYVAAVHQKVGRRELVANTRRIVGEGVETAAGKPFQFHTWVTDPVSFEPMDPGWLRAILMSAAEEGAKVLEIYTFKTHDWRARGGGDERPAFREVSLKYQPEMLRQIRRIISKLK
jgi:hypothetical protein